MKTLAQKLVIGLLTTALMTCVVGAAQAWPGPGPHPGPHPGPWYPPVVIHHPRPYIIASYCEDASNPAPAADIQLVNPAKNQVTLKYTLNGGAVQLLQAGYSAQINQVSVIEFDRGGGAGRARYSMTDGTYTFKPTNGGYWGLFRESAANVSPETTADLAANPLPGK
jgi:hypothetical protein